MLEEPFSSGTSLLHSLPARTKVAAALLQSVCIAPLTSPAAAGGILTCSALLLAWAQLPLRPLLKRLALVNVFTLLLWVFLPFSTPGSTVYMLGPLHLTAEGIAMAGLITLKTNAILCAFIALVGTSTITDVGGALHALRMPRKLTLLFLFTWRYIHVIAEEYERLTTAARIRGFVPATNGHTYRTYANLAAMVLVRSWERAERVNSAMRLRGFTGTFHSLHEDRLDSGTLGTSLLLSVPALTGLVLDLYLRFNPLH